MKLPIYHNRLCFFNLEADKESKPMVALFYLETSDREQFEKHVIVDPELKMSTMDEIITFKYFLPTMKGIGLPPDYPNRKSKVTRDFRNIRDNLDTSDSFNFNN
ncbi:MAG: hypothetical protein FJ333_05150, partial [Sphingomonadales bacterium]|nr:hypothetical protein [Sphingomonadales bacterium]